MRYSRVNHLQRYIIIQKIVSERYEPEVTTYAGIWRKYVNPIYPMTYKRFIEIINMHHLQTQLEEDLKYEKERRDNVSKNQLVLF